MEELLFPFPEEKWCRPAADGGANSGIGISEGVPKALLGRRLLIAEEPCLPPIPPAAANVAAPKDTADGEDEEEDGAAMSCRSTSADASGIAGENECSCDDDDEE